MSACHIGRANGGHDTKSYLIVFIYTTQSNPDTQIEVVNLELNADLDMAGDLVLEKLMDRFCDQKGDVESCEVSYNEALNIETWFI